jgi:DnaJ-class molecular chaperone
MENVREDKTFIPEKHGMIFCPHCNGLGKFFNGPKRFYVCETCGGFGAIRKPKEANRGLIRTEQRKITNP